MKYLVRLLCLTLVLSLASAPAAQMAAQHKSYHEHDSYQGQYHEDGQHEAHYGVEQNDEFDEQAYNAWPYRPAVRPSLWILGILVGAVVAMIFMNESGSGGYHH